MAYVYPDSHSRTRREVERLCIPAEEGHRGMEDNGPAGWTQPECLRRLAEAASHRRCGSRAADTLHLVQWKLEAVGMRGDPRFESADAGVWRGLRESERCRASKS